MKHERNRVDAEAATWSYGYFLPGLLSIGFIVVARLLGWLQPLELVALDTALRWRSPESTDERITIVGINEEDIQTVGAYPIPDGVLAKLLWKLQSYDPQVIGLDIVRDLPVEPGHDALLEAFQSAENIIGVETIVPDRFGSNIAPPPSLPPEQVGFIDNILDVDGHVRRSLLGASTPDEDYQFSIALRLAMAYLQPYGFELDNGIRDPVAMRFGHVELPRLHSNSGGYVRTDAGGNQTLLNFRSGPEPFRIVSLAEVMNGSVNPEWLRDRVVLIGITAASAKDIFRTSAVASSNPGLVFGVEIHAHATSQIISAVLDGRSLLRVWPDGWEYGWVLLWGMLGLGMSRFIHRQIHYLLWISVTGLGLLSVGYISVWGGWWIPIVPALLAFLLNGVILHVFCLYHHTLQSRIRDRQLVIEQTFTAIHNGPLQTLAGLIRKTDHPEVSITQLCQDLQQLNQELRSVYESVQKEALQGDQLYLPGHTSLNLNLPLHELLYEVYVDTLQRNFPHFAQLKLKIIKFESFNETGLSSDKKRGVCRFLEEALCNVGKHAVGATRLTIECRFDGLHNVVRVVDNGDSGNPTSSPMPDKSTPSALPSGKGRGTQQAEGLAKQLYGTFERSPHSPKGTRCELRWRPQESPIPRVLDQFKKQLIAIFGNGKD